MIKKERGITIVSLIITIVVMLIVSSTTIYVSLDRNQVNHLRKMINDIELLQDKVSNYYLKFGELPVRKIGENQYVKVPIEQLEQLTRNISDNEVYYIIDLEAMDGITLNYGEEGYEDSKEALTLSSDIYIINEKTHTIYYVKGIEYKDSIYYYIENKGLSEDTIPPSKPQINVISGTQNSEKKYISDVEIEIVPGKDGWSGVNQTKVTIEKDGTRIESETLKQNNLYRILENGKYEISATTQDNSGNLSTEVTTTIIVEIEENIS